MKLLAIDTSTERATVALAIDGTIYTDEQGSLRQHAQLLLPMIEGLLAKASVQLNQLDGIVFGCGPGSFTGLRVTCSIAKALAYAHNLPLFPVSSLAAIAQEVFYTQPHLTPDTHVLAILDARMQQIYWSVISANAHASPESVSAASDVVLSSTAPLILAGVGIDTYAEQLPANIVAQIVGAHTVYPQAEAMIRLVTRGLIQPVSAADALPVYVRELHFAQAKNLI